MSKSKIDFDTYFDDLDKIVINAEIPYEFFEESFLHCARKSQKRALETIAKIELLCEDWDTTEKLIAHFKALEIEMIEEGQADGPIKPKKIDVRL